MRDNGSLGQLQPLRTVQPSHTEQPLFIEYGAESPDIITRLHEDVENQGIQDWSLGQLAKPDRECFPLEWSMHEQRQEGGKGAGEGGGTRNANERGVVGNATRAHTQGKVLETHFDEPYHARSSSYSNMAHSLQEKPVNLNNSFPGCDTSTPYISSSVTLPAVQRQDDHGFYQNVTGRIRQPSIRHKDDARSSFARQADLHKSPRTQELEEFAAKFEGYQKQRTRRMAAQPTPMLDQLARESHNQFWLANPDQLSTLETNLLRLVQRTDSISGRARTLFSDDNSSGRESVTTVISNSSSETLKFNEKHSSSETLKYLEGDGMCNPNEYFGAGDRVSYSEPVHSDDLIYKFGNFSSQDLAVRDRNRSNCDEMYGQGALDQTQWQTVHNFQQDGNFANWRPNEFERDSSRTEFPWEYEGSRLSTYSQATGQQSKRSLYRSHSEAGSVLGDRSIRNSDMNDQGVRFNEPNGCGDFNDHAHQKDNRPGDLNDRITRSGDLGEQNAGDAKNSSASLFSCVDPLSSDMERSCRGPHDPDNGARRHVQKLGGRAAHDRENAQMLEYLCRDGDGGAIRPRWLPDESLLSGPHGVPSKPWQKPALQPVSKPNGCSFCLGRHSDNHENCLDNRRPQDIQDNMTEKNTFPRRATRSRKPKLPTPPCSPKFGPSHTGPKTSTRSTTPSPPPPPQLDHELIATNEPLPPPPVESLPLTQSQGEKTNDFQCLADARSLPAPSSTPTPIPGRNKMPASTPKRDSPATIAAKEAPGWQMFLGVKSSTVSFTSEEATKFRAARDESRSRNANKRDESRNRNMNKVEDNQSRSSVKRDESMTSIKDTSRGRDQNKSRREIMNNFFHKMEENTKTERKEGNPEKRPKTRREEYRNTRSKKISDAKNSSDENLSNGNNFQGFQQKESEGRILTSPDEKQQSLHLSRERSLKSISNWWKSSLEGGPTPPTAENWTDGDTPSPRHNHSHSDSGISSMSGRSSCMSPMSELSSSSGSSRTSLRSSSIVSASNILLEEEGEGEMEYKDLCKELLLFAPPDARIVGIIRSSLTHSLQVYFPEGSLEFEIISNSKENCDPETPKRSRSTNFEESRKNLLKHACMRIDTQRKHQQLLRESTKSNEEVGKEIAVELTGLAQQTEIDKVKLFTEEVDKITSLIIGLSSRLAKASALCAKNAQPDEKSQKMAIDRRDKLGEQLDEARKLRQSIFRRGDSVFGILAKYLDPRSVEAFGGFIKEKIRLILETRQHTEILKSEEEILKCLKEYNSTGVMII